MARLRDTFAALVAAGDACDLARGALEIARIAYPDLEPAPWLRRLDALAFSARSRVAAGLAPDRAALALSTYLFDECGFHGATQAYYDPRNSFLNDVLERRVGIPISLAVLLIEIARRLDLVVEGVGFPGHFLARVHAPGGPLVLDPFSGGRVVAAGELRERLRAFHAAAGGSPAGDDGRALDQALQASRATAILSRMLANLLHIYVQRDNAERALEAADLFLVLSPDAREPLRVRGLLYERLGCDQAALADLRRYLELAPEGPVADQVRARVVQLGARARTLH